MASHFDGMCEDCHTVDGFEQAEMVYSFEHPAPLEGAHAKLDCMVCNTGDERLEYGCASCHRPPSEPHFGSVCNDCHTTTSFEGATIPSETHPIPLVSAHLRATCGRTPRRWTKNTQIRLRQQKAKISELPTFYSSQGIVFCENSFFR
jgi:hypothetical protein